MSTRLRQITAVLLGLALVTACSSSDRPSELSMEDVKPCDLIPDSDLEQLDVQAKPHGLDSVPGVDMKGRTCQFLVLHGNNLWISQITNHGIDRWIDGPIERARFKDVPRIHGFRTIEVWRSDDSNGPNDRCKLFVDVANGQSLRIKVDESYDEDDPPTCDTARQFAGAAMKTLVDTG